MGYTSPKPVCFSIIRKNTRCIPTSVLRRILTGLMGETSLEMLYATGISSEKDPEIISPSMVQPVNR
ncbi:MAG: hypothetical protein NG784_15580 [Candidatus Jettenia sp.]|nr:hypothetical protein [Candidatus Jettenia sp.]